MSLTKAEYRKLVRIYDDPIKTSNSIQGLYKKAKEEGMKITREKIKSFLQEQPTYQKLFTTTKKQEKPPRTITGPVGHYFADLAFLNKYKSQNKGFIGFLTCINTLSRKGYAIPFKHKTAPAMKSVIKQLVETIQANDKKFIILQTDNGSEFINEQVKTYLDEQNIEQRFCKAEDHHCAGIIERFNKTIKAKLTFHFIKKNTTQWVDELPNVLRNYNNTLHSSLQETPNNQDEDVEEQLQRFFKDTNSNLSKIDEPYKIGDQVRLRLTKKRFSKEGQTYSDIVYTIIKINRNTLKVKDEKTDEEQLVKKEQVLIIPKTRKSLRPPRVKNALVEADKKAKQQRRLKKYLD